MLNSLVLLEFLELLVTHWRVVYALAGLLEALRYLVGGALREHDVAALGDAAGGPVGAPVHQNFSSVLNSVDQSLVLYTFDLRK